MKSVACYNNKGGVGKTTFALHLSLRAQVHGIKTIAVCIDRQGDLFHALSGGDQPTRDGAVAEIGSGLTVIYSPNNIPRLQGASLVIYDCPPAIEVAAAAKPDLWLVPADGRMALTDLGNVLEEMADAGGDIWVVLNKLDTAGKRALAAAKNAVKQIPNVHVWGEPIPDSAAIKRGGEYLKPVWEVPYGKGTDGERAIVDLCDAALVHLGLLRRR